MQLWDESQSFNQQATFKIAIASSTIFAGIVGSEKLTYDYWGDGILFIYLHVNLCSMFSLQPWQLYKRLWHPVQARQTRLWLQIQSITLSQRVSLPFNL